MGNKIEPKITNEELRLFVGRKADYYMKQFEMIQATQPVSKMNIPALLVSLFWLFYRKMYLIGIAFFLTIVVVTTSSDIIFINLLGYASTPKIFSGALSMMFPAICATFANKWYLFHAKRKITEIKQRGTVDNLQLDAIKKKGGTSIVASILGPALLLFFAFAVLVTIELLKKGKI